MHAFRSVLLSLLTVTLLMTVGCNHADNARVGGTTLSAAAGTAPPLFAEVASAAGLRYRWTVAGKRPLNILQTIGNGCAFLDYDNDGNLDILLIGPQLALYKGDGKGHFTDVTRSMGLDRCRGHFLGCAVGDYDNDGYDDLYISAYRGGILLHNEHGKGFRNVTRQSGIASQAWGTSCAFGDFDGDGKLDLYICNYADFGPETQPQLCDFHGIPSSCGPHYYTPLKGKLYHNLGQGRFQDVTGPWKADSVHGRGLGVAFADYNASGRQSLVIANDENPGDLLANQGGHFRNVGVESGTAYDSATNVHGGMGLDWGDSTNSGRFDLVVATFFAEDKCLYRNDGNGIFAERCRSMGLSQPLMPYVSFGVKFLDYDNDGFLDLCFANGHVQDNIDRIEKTTYREPLALMHNEAGKQFQDVSSLAGPAFTAPLVGRGLAVGDFDNDGKLDLLVVDSEGSPLLLHNRVAGSGHWLGVKLVGVRSNRDGYGAILKAEANGLHLTQRCGTDGSYLSASDRRVHFGLGGAKRVDILTVQWPSGIKDVFHDVPADQYLTIREGTASKAPAQSGAGSLRGREESQNRANH